MRRTLAIDPCCIRPTKTSVSGFANYDFDGGKQSLQESVHSERRSQEWDPSERGLTVHVRNRPGKLGRTTGQTKMSGSHLMVEVDFGPNEKSFKRYAVLERQAEQLSVERLIREGRFGGADDLRRILVLEKVKGELTNIIYSMDSGLTEFYPHQFKPVLRFLESHTGRLLIADEVGLGKTVEAAYIWKELEAREFGAATAGRVPGHASGEMEVRPQAALRNFQPDRECQGTSGGTARGLDKEFIRLYRQHAVDPAAAGIQ